MRVALDSNVLLYFVGVVKSAADARKRERVRPLIDSLEQQTDIVCAWQVFGECYRVMLASGRSRPDCRAILMQWRSRFEVVESSERSFLAATDLATDHALQFWDALILNVAAEAGCSLFLSEDMQAGFVWRGMTIVNPFDEPLHPRLSRLLSPQ